MALTRADCLIWDELKRRGAIPNAPALLEIGEANWYGDMPIAWIWERIERGSELEREYSAACDRRDVFGLARVFYAAALGVSRRVAIDLHAPPGSAAHALDLNEPIDLGEKFDVIVNTGTVEHVFDQRRALETVHNHCRTGGLMLHAGPLGGWPDHGLFHAQPGLWLDLAKANGYAVEALAYFDLKAGKVAAVRGLGELRRFRWADGSMLYVVLRKVESGPFRVPMQGVYSEAPDEAALADWRALR